MEHSVLSVFDDDGDDGGDGGDGGDGMSDHERASHNSRQSSLISVAESRAGKGEHKAAALTATPADRELSQSILTYLLENLQPFVWAKRSRALRNFQEYYFTQFPPLSKARTRLFTASRVYTRITRMQTDVLELLCGRACKGRGLLETVSGTNWTNGRLKNSAALAVAILVRLLDPTEHPGKLITGPCDT